MININNISYENIDLFYYHSIDYDFSRFFSIINNGIVSKKVAIEEKLDYYYRNYTHASNRDNYVSVNHFPRTIFSYYKLENELYDFNKNKICFIIDDINALDKQFYKNHYKYTNERHVLNKINCEQIKGILLRDIDAHKKLNELKFNINFTDYQYLEKKVFNTVKFFINNYGQFANLDKLYYLMGKFSEAKTENRKDEVLIMLIARLITKSINECFSKILNKEEPIVLDVIKYLNNGKYPIYIMNKYDLKRDNEKLRTDNSITIKNSKLIKEAEEKEQQNKKILKLLKKMSFSGVEIYYGYREGSFNEEDAKIYDEIQKLSLTKN